MILLLTFKLSDECGISSQWDIRIWIGDVTFTMLLVSQWTAWIYYKTLKFTLHDPLILVSTFKVDEQV